MLRTAPIRAYIPASNVPRARKFYEEILGLRPKEQYAGGVIYECGGNHHHMLQAADRVNGKILWANLHLLFWLSLTPFVTAWMGESHAARVPTAAYGGVLLLSAVAYTILQAAIIAAHGPGSKLAAAVQRDVKGKISLLCYATAIPLAFVEPVVSIVLYVAVALLWLVPDRRIESRLQR
jgi:uncharacterized membrane protein